MKKTPSSQEIIKTIENHRFDDIQLSDSMSPLVQNNSSQVNLKIPPNNTEEMCNFLDSIIACMPHNVYWLDRNCILIGGNDNLAKMFGLKSRKELEGLTYEEMGKLANWTDGQGDSFRKVELEVMASGKARYNIEEPPFLLNGKVRHFLASKVPLFNKKGEVIGIVGISSDITEQKEAEAALKKAKEEAEVANQAKSYFIASLGHEFRTPLNHIMGLSEILRHNIDSLPPEEQKEYLKNIYDSGNDLLSLLNDIIFFSRVEMGYFKINFEKTHLREIIAKVINSNQHRAAEKNIIISSDYPEHLPTHVWADKLRVRQVLVNLIENAIKFTTKGSIHISATIEDPIPPSNRPMLRINITDTGIGIQEEKMELLFKKFTQVHSNYKDQNLGRYPGVGLGLAITKELVELMDGNVNAVSTFGEGSTFSFTLPINP